jgi:hypothetical protein
MAKGHLQSHERNGEIEYMVTAVACYSPETGGQRVVMMMNEGKVSRWFCVAIVPGATGFDRSMLRQ